MSLPDYPQKVAGLSSEELEGLDEVVYVRPEDGASFSLNITAAAVLELCNGQHSRTDIAAELDRALTVGRERAVADVEAIISNFVECGLIYTDDPA